MHLKISSAKWRPFCLGLNVLIQSEGSEMLPPAAWGVPSSHHCRSAHTGNSVCLFDAYNILKFAFRFKIEVSRQCLKPRCGVTWSYDNLISILKMYTPIRRCFILKSLVLFNMFWTQRRLGPVFYNDIVDEFSIWWKECQTGFYTWLKLWLLNRIFILRKAPCDFLLTVYLGPLLLTWFNFSSSMDK